MRNCFVFTPKIFRMRFSILLILKIEQKFDLLRDWFLYTSSTEKCRPFWILLQQQPSQRAVCACVRNVIRGLIASKKHNKRFGMLIAGSRECACMGKCVRVYLYLRTFFFGLFSDEDTVLVCGVVSAHSQQATKIGRKSSRDSFEFVSVSP